MKTLLVSGVLIFSMFINAQEVDSTKIKQQKEAFDAKMAEIQDGIDKANKLLESQLRFKAIDLNTISKKERKGWEYNYDKFKGITFISKSWPLTPIYPYIGVNDNGYMYLRLKARYSGKNWVFYDKIIFLIDGEKFEFDPITTSRNVTGSAGVVEHSDTPVDQETFNLLTKIVNGKTVEYRFSGERISDGKISSKGIETIKATLDLFEKLKAE